MYFCSHVLHLEKLCTCAVISDLQDLWGKQMDNARALRSSTERIAGSGYEIVFNGELNIATSKDFLLKITKLNGENYRDWAFNMRLYLESMDLIGHADGSVENPAEEASEQVM